MLKTVISSAAFYSRILLQSKVIANPILKLLKIKAYKVFKICRKNHNIEYKQTLNILFVFWKNRLEIVYNNFKNKNETNMINVLFLKRYYKIFNERHVSVA